MIFTPLSNNLKVGSTFNVVKVKSKLKLDIRE